MSLVTVDCPVTATTADPFGDYVNAFRLLPDGGDVLLDFCVYSAQAGTARLVSRLRIKPHFLDVIHARLSDTLKAVPQEATIYVMPEIGGHQ